MALDVTYRVQIPHRPGQLAAVASVIAERGGLIGDVVTAQLARDATIREITVELRDLGHAWDLAADLNALPGVQVVWHHDRAFIRHDGGKLAIRARQPVTNVQEMRDIYTPGVARICTAIAENPSLANRYTMVGQTVAIVTNGSRVLGLGDIGPLAAMPVMEGKAVFYDQCAGLSAMPILIDASDVDAFVESVVRIAPTFGGIHLEDISAPACFEIEQRLIDALPQPVMHDDVHGTAVVTLAAAIAACRYVDRRLDESVVGQLGLGAAGFGIASLIKEGGALRVLAFDPDERSHARALERGIEIGSMEQVLAESDVVVATTGRPGLIKPEMVRAGQVVLALTNPVPEIWPDDALAAGAAHASDGSSVNNVLGYPGIFRGALMAGADRITTEMKLAAASTLAGLALESELVPDPLDRSVHDAVAEAVRKSAVDAGLGDSERVSPALYEVREPSRSASGLLQLPPQVQG